MNILSLPQDLLGVMLSFLPVRDVARCSRCCSLFQAAASDDSLWVRLLRRDNLWSDFIQLGVSPEVLYKSLSAWCFEPTSAKKLTADLKQVEPASAAGTYFQVPHAKRVMTAGVHSWEIVVRASFNMDCDTNFYFVGVGTHASASCGATCVDANAYVLGFDGELYKGGRTIGTVMSASPGGCFGLVLDCNKHELHFFRDGTYAGCVAVPAEPLVAIVAVGADNAASIRPPSLDYTFATRRGAVQSQLWQFCVARLSREDFVVSYMCVDNSAGRVGLTSRLKVCAVSRALTVYYLCLKYVKVCVDSNEPLVADNLSS